MQHLTAAVVGAGFIGPVHIEALRRLGVRIAGVLPRTPGAGARLGLPEYRDLDELLADATVDLALPNREHLAFATRCLGAGKHVMCEKPLAMRSEESAELVRLAAASGLEAGVCHNVRSYPLNVELRERIKRGDLGKLFTVTGSYVQDWLLHDTDFNWRVLADEGGAEIEAVFAELKTVHPVRRRPQGGVQTFTGAAAASTGLVEVPIATDDCACVILRMTGGVLGSLHVSQVTAGRKNCIRYEIAGSSGSAAWNSEDPNELWLGQRDEPNRVLMRDPALLSPAARAATSYPGGHQEGFPDTFKQCFHGFYEAVAAAKAGTPVGERRYPTFADGHQEMLLCDALLESHRNQRWATVRRSP
jgi:predicted dehydrogenase